MINNLIKKSIGIFDSGIGGLTVAHAIKKLLPNENIIYFGDTLHLPYGEKSPELIKKFSKRIAEFLIEKKCKAIIIACNSASSVALETVKNISDEIPVFNVIDPVINYISKSYENIKIGVIGTKATIQSKIYKKKIEKLNKKIITNCLQTPLLAPMIEEGFINENISKTIIDKYLSNEKLKYIKCLILACTHYPLIQQEINNYYYFRKPFKGNVHLIDSPKIVAKHVLENIKYSNNNPNPEYKFYVSNYTKSFEESACYFFKENIELEEINLFN